MRIEDYAVIGDCHTAALVGRNGSIDWLCMPRFDSGACFAALLGEPKHGRWLIAPNRKVKAYKRCAVPHVTRRYRGDSLILETEFRTATGVARVIDFMPAHGPDRSIVRIVEGVSGHVRMETELVIRFDYGVTIPWVNRIDSKTITAIAGPNLLCVRTPIALHGENMHSAARFTIHKGERSSFCPQLPRVALPSARRDRCRYRAGADGKILGGLDGHLQAQGKMAQGSHALAAHLEKPQL